MSEYIRKVYVTGHLNPDTDSICSAISYAYLKNQLGGEYPYEARRAGAVSRETQFVLDHFGFEEPEIMFSIAPQIKDAKYTKMKGVDGEMSMFDAFNLMTVTNADTLCITDAENALVGLIALKDIARANLNIFDNTMLGSSRTT